MNPPKIVSVSVKVECPDCRIQLAFYPNICDTCRGSGIQQIDMHINDFIKILGLKRVSNE